MTRLSLCGLLLLAGCITRIPPADGGIECANGTTQRCDGGCLNHQVCANGQLGACVPNCAAGLACDGAKCACTAASCANGCCEGDACRPGSDATACGAGGTTCTACPSGESCSSGACSGCVASCAGCCSGSTCATASLGACGAMGSVCRACNSTTADSCDAAGVCACGSGAACGPEQRCVNGTCVCDSVSCANGCCSGAACVAPSVFGCGTAGSACTLCDGTRADQCVNGTCACGSSAPCAGLADRCLNGACRCGASPACDARADACMGASCRCGVTSACDARADQCVGGTCRCGATPACDATTADACMNGSCRCGTGAACASGQQCAAGTCVTAAACGAGPACLNGQRCVSGSCVCDATSCPSGCCDGAVCRTSAFATCGSGGVACTACSATTADRCENGGCVCGTSAACTGPLQCLGASTNTGAVAFDDQQDRMGVPSGAWPTSTASWTFASWVRLAVDRNEYSAFFTLEQPIGHSTEYNELVTLQDGTTLVLWDHSTGAAITLGSMTVGTWYFAAISVGPGGAASAWFGPEGGTLTKRTGTVALVDHVEMSWMGASNFAFTEFINGSMAMARLWNGVLSDADVTAEFASSVPVRTTGLIGDWRLSSAATVGTDSSGLMHHLVLNPGATHGTTTGPTLSGSTRVCR